MYAKKTGKRVKYIGLLRTNQECQKKIKMGSKIDNAQESTIKGTGHTTQR